MATKKRKKASPKKAKKVVTKKKKPIKKLKTAKGKSRAKAVSKKGSSRKTKTPNAALTKIGEVTHYFPHVNAAAVMLLRDGLHIGDTIYLKGHTTDFKEKVSSIQLDHVAITEGKKAQEIGLFVKSRVRIGDSVYKI